MSAQAGFLSWNANNRTVFSELPLSTCPGLHRFISRETITACCPQCSMHLQSMGLELYSQHSFQQGEPSKTPTVCLLMTFPSVPQHSALAYTFCRNSPFFLRPLWWKRGTTCAQDEAPYSGRNADNTFKC